MKITKNKKDLLPYNAVIQVYPKCGKLDVYLNDGHICDAEYEELKSLKK